MFRKILYTILFLILLTDLKAQFYYTKSARISFYSKAPLENIEALNKTAGCILNTKTGSIQFVVLIKGFEFPKALMQEHFNENYLESNKYPNGLFKGMITNNSEIDYGKPGAYSAKVKGELTIHGVTNEIETSGTISINASLDLNSTFTILLSEYHISIPALVKDKVSNNVKISINAKLEPLKN